jgi:hypothetical protein
MAPTRPPRCADASLANAIAVDPLLRFVICSRAEWHLPPRRSWPIIGGTGVRLTGECRARPERTLGISLVEFRVHLGQRDGDGLPWDGGCKSEGD